MIRGARIAALLVVAALLAGCGVDGDPETPEEPAEARSNISITGTVEFGIGGSF